jgi:RHS repeat-associated protein
VQLLNTTTPSEARQMVQYVDGLGRPLQTVERGAAPSGYDQVTPFTYDAFGRPQYNYLPYVHAGSSDGTFKTDPFGSQKTFYQSGYKSATGAAMLEGEQFFYSQTQYEASPLNRVQQTLAPGNSWVGSGRGVQTLNLFNTAADAVRIWTITSDPLTYAGEDLTTNIPLTTTSYNPGTLSKQVTLDEDGKAVVTYTDLEGRLVLKKVQVAATVPSDYSGLNGFLSTYYIYDELGRLSFVVPPKAVEGLQGDWNVASRPTLVSELCFRYSYDGRGRTIGKKVPGAAWVYLVYDSRDRLVFEQNGWQRARAQWSTTLYDALNRVVQTGITTYSGTPSGLQSLVTTQTTTAPAPPSSVAEDLVLSTPTTGTKQALRSITLTDGFESTGGDFTAEILSSSGSGGEQINIEGVVVNKSPLPSGAVFIPLTQSFWDDYSWTAKTYTPAYNAYLDAGTNLHSEGTVSTASTATVGLETGTRVRVLSDPTSPASGAWLTTVNFYDAKARMLQSQSDQAVGGTDIITNLYDFKGRVLSSCLSHGGPTPIVVTTDFTYDVGGRLVEQAQRLGTDRAQKIRIAKNSYDELGHLLVKEVGRRRAADGSFTSTPLEKLDYSYNIRGFLKGINAGYAHPELTGAAGEADRLFGLELSYDWGFGQGGLYNGNISGVRWRSGGDGRQRAYGFAYDGAGRLLQADFTQKALSGWNTSEGVDFSLGGNPAGGGTMRYDGNGNITELWQKGLRLRGSPYIDQLQYSYGAQSNKLLQVLDGVNDTATRLGDFRTSKSYITALGGSKPATAVDYSYDSDGNLTGDLNKDIASGGISYNHLGLPWRITTPKGTITYSYDATGIKTQKTTTEDLGGGKSITTTTTYAGPFIYQSVQHSPTALPEDYAARVQFFSQGEGRTRPVRDASGVITNWVNDYFIRDHLGNVRMVLTDEYKTYGYPPASMELAKATTEEALYGNVATSRADKPSLYPADGTTDPNDKVARVGGNYPKIGPSITLKVMAGDKVNLRASSWYRSGGSSYGTPVSPLTELVQALTSGVVKTKEGASLTDLQSSGVLNTPAQGFLAGQPNLTTMPKAFLNYLLLDEQLHLVAASSGSDPVGADGELKIHQLQDLAITANGYLYVYVSNESALEVYFDNLQVTHTHGPILEETHYYPFGLAMAGISSKAAGSLENRIKYNGIEKETDLALEIYDAQLRELDPQIGRWWQVDPKTEELEMWSPYVSNYNSPLRYSDPFGDEGDDCCGGLFDLAKDFYEKGVLPGVNWINHNLNPVYGVVNGIQGQFTGKDLLTGEKLSRADGASDFVFAVLPGGKIEGTLYKATERAITKDVGKVVEKQVTKKIDRQALKRGLDNEAKVLAEEGLHKNKASLTTIDPKTGKKVTTIPDANLSNGATVEVKDVKKLSDSKQLRAQSAISSQNGQKARVITGVDTKVSNTVEKRMKVDRKNYLGPQN